MSQESFDPSPNSPRSLDSPNPLMANPLAPPPELKYSQKGELVDAIQSWAREHGYAIVTKYSNFKEARYVYQCDKSGEYQNEKLDPTQLGQTRKTNCPFRVSGSFYKKSGLWEVIVQCPHHNNPPSEDPSTHLLKKEDFWPKRMGKKK